MDAKEKQREGSFQKREDGIKSERVNAFKTGESSKSISNMGDGRDKELPSFWIPDLTPASAQSAVPKPVSGVCRERLKLFFFCAFVERVFKFSWTLDRVH